ncbi:MAG: hypothetical protein EBU49_02270 [Proteobacteria bacterium]|nr:hypothetical protein [Pseudomonadota bacterium]
MGISFVFALRQNCIWHKLLPSIRLPESSIGEAMPKTSKEAKTESSRHRSFWRKIPMRCVNKNLFLIMAGPVFGCALFASSAGAAEINRRFITEIDPVAPSSALYEQRASGITTSKFGASVDFNVGENFSVGPEFWSGTFLAKGDSLSGDMLRREDMFPGERHKIDAMRLRWNMSFWEIPSSMRGWYTRLSYDYVKVNSRANRYTESTRYRSRLVPESLITFVAMSRWTARIPKLSPTTKT